MSQHEVQLISMQWAGAPCRGDAPQMRDLWVRMRCSAAGVLACVLLPGRAQMVVRSNEGQACDRVRAVGERAALQGVRIDASSFAGAEAAGRVLAAVHASPTRIAGIEDPLQWPWSTLRDLVGAVIDPWVTPAMLAAASFTQPLLETGAAPRAAPQEDAPTLPIREVLRAAAAATRRPVAAVRRPGPTRRLFVALAHRHGWWMPAHLASICGITRRSLYKQLEHVPAAWLRAGALCLGDHRLRAVVLATPGRAFTEARVCSTR
jgi:hypothetical protein